ncbi:NHLP bacteriocin export ABC transporter permease/ATPase subunit [Paenibacillus glycinis]|uniref:NHLP bacteriocin export ABC transporter permease/ATPase subunit n=1 Tax=Paenibacillus glycinis TaxID=2697035 RepID=A0ABW9XS33_9BACL|nr:NHLP bacteriocin export ABC transporter permease/ATPase subunit [Paenibacillus glycinis]NBD25154.1 NHLP bacteriocin export ABC transporter permease/ATPase subunit [Paenibacillus glycinis]
MIQTEISELRRLFEERGSAAGAEGNRPLIIRDEAEVWLVQAGHADVFAVSLHEEEVVRQRRFLFSLEPGRLLYGYHAGGDGKNGSAGMLIAGLTGTRLLRMDRAAFVAALSESRQLREAAARSIDAWIEAWSTALAGADPAEAFVALTPGESAEAPAQAILRASQPAWVRLNEGELHWMGDAELAVDRPGALFPLTAADWMTAAVPSNLSVHGTLEWLELDPELQGLSDYHRGIADCLRRMYRFEERFERERLKLKTEQDHAVMERALRRLASITGGPTAGTAADARTGDDLYVAARRVGEAAGLNVLPAKAARLRKSRDPVSEIAKASGFRSRQVMLKDDWWRTDNGPLLAFLEEGGHPVALVPSGAAGYRLIDAGGGEGTVVTEQLAGQLETVAHMFYRPFPAHALSVLDILKFGSHRSIRRDFAKVLALGIASGLLAMFIPIANGILFDSVIPASDQGPLLQMGLILLSIALATALFEVTRSLAMLRIEGKMDGSIQAAVWDRLLNMPASFFRQFTAGDLASRANSINAIRKMLSGVAVTAVFTGIFSVFNFFLLFHYDVKLALAAAVLVIVPMLVTVVIGIVQVRKQRVLLQAQGKLTGTVLQIIDGISKFRMAGAEKRAFFLWAKLFGEMKETSFRARRVSDIHAVFNAFYPIVTSIALFYLVATNAQGLSAGQFIAFFSAFTAFLKAMINMSGAVVSMINIVPLFERTKPILQTVPEAHEAAEDPGELAGGIEVRHVNFRYAAEQPLILNDLSLTIRPGEFVALVGASGCGKSSLLRLLLGFEKAESGSVFYDGQDMKSLDIRSVRSQLGVVLQHGKVMAGDIYSNIVGSTNLTHEDAWEAARMAGLDQDIQQMPMGMHTVISEGGGTLSGGQRQRLLIARALARRPKILFFDEATSALDNRTQAIVSESLEKLRATRVVIAHRLSTIMNADRIFVLDRGRLVQAGTYAELMEQDGLFMELAKRQLA